MADPRPGKKSQPEPDFSALNDAVVDTTPPWQVGGTPAAADPAQGPTFNTSSNSSARVQRRQAESSAAKMNLIIGAVLLVVGVLLFVNTLDSGAAEVVGSGRRSGRLATGAIFGGIVFLVRGFLRTDRR